MAIPKKVRIVEVGPRDGLQNETVDIPTAAKIELINQLSQTGLSSIEVTSFVSQKRIPQLADAFEVFSNIQKENHVHYSALVPNIQGMAKALSANVKEIAVFTAASETFSQKNTHCSIEESLLRIQEIARLAKQHSIRYRGYISCALGCPYEGFIEPEKVARLAKRLLSLGCFEISLGDTIGVANPKTVQKLITTLTQTLSIDQLALHFHDTYGQALVNLYAGLELGISVVDSAITGLGGCPYAYGASGNVATEDVVYLLDGLGVETSVDLDKLLQVSEFIAKLMNKPLRSKVAEAKLGMHYGRFK